MHPRIPAAASPLTLGLLTGTPRPAVVLPVGAGVTLRAGEYVFFTFEGLYYFTTTDRLDDVSQRGNPNSLDSFATGTFKLEYALHRKKPKPLVHFD